MRKRLYFLLPDVTSTRQIVDELLLARIDDHHIHVLANDDTPLDNLPRANLLQTSVTGLVGGIVATIALSLGTMIGGVILACTLVGAMFGLWTSGMIGSNVRNSCLKRFEKAIDEGQILLMIDVPAGRTKEISRLVKAHKESREGGVEPSLPAFP